MGFDQVLRLMLRSPWVKRVSRGVPVARLLLVAEVAIMAQRHLSKLDSAQRRRLFTLLVRARGWPRSLTAEERREFLYLVARLEPRLLLGTTVKRFSPLPLPKRLLYGRCGSAARAALARQN
jgi:hypothetical protein